MSQATINGIDYNIGKFPGGAEEAFKVFRRVHLRGIIEDDSLLAPPPLPVNGEQPAESPRTVSPIMRSFANMSDADFRIVMQACLRCVSWKDPTTGGFAQLVGPSGGLMFSGADDVSVQMQLAMAAMDENFQSFSATPTPQSSVAASPPQG